MSARRGGVSPVGGGTCSTTAFSRSATPSPGLAETRITSPRVRHAHRSIAAQLRPYLAGWAAGKSCALQSGDRQMRVSAKTAKGR